MNIGRKIRGFVRSIIALCFPWLILLMHDNPGGALIALIMQATIIGWPFATVWAWRVSHGTDKPKAKKPDSISINEDNTK